MSVSTIAIGGGRIPRGSRATTVNQPMAPPATKQTPITSDPSPLEDDGYMEVSSNGTGSGGAGGNTVGRGDMANSQNSRRRSNVVKEVEKLKKNREERRLRQAEIKNEKENLMNIDPGNPNWEFLNMIR